MESAGTMVMDKVLAGEIAPALSLTVTLNEGVGVTVAVVGVPLIAPVEALRDKPAGSDPLLTV